MNRAHHKSSFLQSLTPKRIQQFFFKTALALAALVLLYSFISVSDSNPVDIPFKTWLKSMFHPQEILSTIEKPSLKQAYLPEESLGKKVSGLFKAKEGLTLTLSNNQVNVAIQIPAYALPHNKIISITALRENELPVLNPDMVNVTAGASGYRFLPHGSKFSIAANLKIPYDSTLIPEGYTPEDIRSYYFDEQERRWLDLPLDSVDAQAKMVLSHTLHFTDMINGIIKVPESPETEGYAPTSIKDFKPADPSAGITMIAPPVANNYGNASSSFDLKLPAGRQGMEPNLSIQYNNNGGNGWLGLGWDLTLPFISIDTRWGAPRFDPSDETETYTLIGEQLAPMAHRGALVKRSSEKEFYPRVEGSFDKIIRHGDRPSNYWWEIINKQGARSFYGGLPESGVVQGAVLSDDKGNIAHWALVQTRDLDNNCEHYTYAKVQDPGVQGGSSGQQLYIDKITYTGTTTQEGPYSVVFTRDRQLGETKRKDVSIDGRYGYKMVTADLLRKITVNLNGQLIRSYELKYKEGAFYKTLLQNISELDDAGKVFYAHSFDYYDDVNASAGYVSLGEQKKWSIENDEINTGIINPIPGFTDQSSALSTEKSNSIGFGLAVTVGFIGDGWSKQATVGGSFEFDHTTNEGLVCMVDINGDELPDKVTKQGNRLFYRANLKDANGFGPPKPVLGRIDQFSAGTALSFGVGLQIIPFGPLFLGYNFTSTTTKTSTYFSDFNGDGLIDIAHNGLVLFNHIDSQGNPVFEPSSTLTPNPLFLSASVDKTFLAPDTALQRRQEQEFPLQDIIRFWTAPFDGDVRVDAPVQLIQVADSLRSKKEDGVRVSIQLRDKTLWATAIPKGDFGIKNPSDVNRLQVKKGDKIYFRVQSIYNGENDAVNWNPAIDYLNSITPDIDASNKRSSHYRASEDFIITGAQPIGIPRTGGVRIAGNFKKSITSDTVVLRVIRTDTFGKKSILFRKVFPPKTQFDGALEAIESTVQQGDVLHLEVHADSYIDRTAVTWFPSYETTFRDTVTGKPVVLRGTVVPSNNDYNTWQIPTPVQIKNKPGELKLYPDIRFRADSSGTVVFTIKGLDTLYTKKIIRIEKGKVAGNLDTISLDVPPGTRLFPEFHISNEVFAQALENTLLISKKDTTYSERDTTIKDSVVFKVVNKVILDTLQAGVYTNSSQDEPIPVFRRWGQFTFTGDKGDGPLDESKLNFKELKNNNYEKIIADTALYRQDTSSIRKVKSPTKTDFAPLYGNGQKRLWVGRDSAAFVSATTMSSSRLMMHDVSVDSLMLGTGSSLTAVSKVEQSFANTLSAGAVLIAGYSNVQTTNMLDMMDMNGDAYPDVLHTNDVQYTLPNGALEREGRKNALLATNSTGNSIGLNFGGEFPRATASNKRNSTASNANNNKTRSNARSALATAASAIGFPGNLGYNLQSTNVSWIDMNGDGLPDKVYQDGQVALNLGYSFTPLEDWNFKGIDESKSLNFGAGIGVNLISGTIQAGIGLTRSEDNTNFALLDVNGDGLPDKISATGNLNVQLNTGNGFAAPLPWHASNIINNTTSTGESINVALTIPIPIIVVKICINPSFNIGHGVSSQTDQIMDIDGDGFPDLLHSEDDGDLSVRKSTIGRTNMLRKVQCPLGSSFAMDYEQLGSTYRLSQNVWVLKNLEVFDGVPGDGVDTMRSSFKYLGGYYDRREREFYGFDTVLTQQLNTAEKNALYRSSEEVFLTSNYYNKGLLQSATLRDAAGKIFTQNTNEYELRTVRDSVFFPALIKSTQFIYEGNTTPGASTYSQYDYDALGNIIKIIDIGDGSPEDLINATVKYHNNDALYIKAIPSEIVVNTSEGVKRRRTTTIDGKGHITQISQFLADGTSANHNMEYDQYGNLSKILRPANYKGQRMFHSYVYDDLIHSYVTKTSDAYGYSSSMEYEYRFGNVIRSTSLQNEQMRFAIDNRGRISTVTGPYELAAGKPYTIAFDYHPEAKVPYAITHHYDPEYDDDIDIITFVDGLGRAIEVKKMGSIFKGKNQDDELKMIVSGATVYDAFGRTIESYFPTTEPLGASNTSLSGTQGKISEIVTYDVLDRVRTQKLADGATSSLSYQAIDNLLLTQMTDALGNKAETYQDVRGRQRSVKQYGGPNGTISTIYFYNALSELLRVEDNNQNSIVNTYDNLGRRLSVKHPDAGLTEYKYDLTGNLLEKITAQLRKQIPQGGAIKYAYDFERIVDIDYPIQYQNKVSYSYGAPGSGNRTGRLTLVKDASGGREFYYGKLGEVTKEIRTVLVNTVFYTTYVSEQEYDTWNRIKKMTYPDGEVVSYKYNRAGNLYSIDGQKNGNPYPYVSKLGYDEFEAKVYLKYGNGTETTYAFDEQRRRLQTLQAATPKGQLMLNNKYSYDAVSNITGILNEVQAQPGKLGGRASQKYTYDNLFRLIGATGAYQGAKDTATYGLEMAYDNLYNIVGKKLSQRDTARSYQQSYLYGGAAPHQATQIGNKKCAYDLNGNLTTFGSSEYFWDEENRLMGVLDKGLLSEYTYDAGGERVIKSSGGMQGTWLNGAPAGTINHHDNYTVYVSPYLVCRRTGFTKHIYMEGERVVSKIGEGSFTNISFPQSALTAGGVNYIQRAAQLKQDRVNYYAGLGISPGPPTQKLFYAEPQNSGIAPPVLVDSTAANVPRGWPGNTTKPATGPPVYVASIPSNDSVKAGYGFRGTGHIAEVNQYFYHKDHLGSTSYVSNVQGEVAQHVEYSAFGETFFEEHSSSNTTPYLYNAKERDEETGLYYYGARYYNPATSQWVGVDPKAGKYPGLSPYCFVANNPILFVDKNGKEIFFSSRGEFIGLLGVNNDIRIIDGDEKIIEIAKSFIKQKDSDLLEKISEPVFGTMEEAAEDWGLRYSALSIKEGKEYGSSIFKVKVLGKEYYSYNKARKGGIDNTNIKLPTEGAVLTGFIHSHGNYLEKYNNNEFSRTDDEAGFTLSGKTGRIISSYLVTPDGSFKVTNYSTNPKMSYERILKKNMAKDLNMPRKKE
ncbi:MAG: toxin TcdB middle/N-terminal domain-containing protein [Haliscomenobacter sp.]|uniref:toxin TcdB middle/N-terminal domain-containing protein n=1 Tax=Haliscomenobacter sp. TaxID=2717303 RepID=UPI0029A80CEA|nr:SpvB/TcaC N-terminal domain-containing protein [Haliscomenobacter sp.]MDX2069123.1 toxin TcdB middle/N-terminal domain-containing protein [Haliscomenobacter sp.]